MNVGIICLLTVGGIKVNIGSLQQGQVLALINYMNQMLLALIVVSNLVVIFTRAEASGNRVKEVLDTENSILEAEVSTTPDFLLKQLSLLTMLTSVILLILVFLQNITFQLKRNTVLESLVQPEAENDFDTIDSAFL